MNNSNIDSLERKIDKSKITLINSLSVNCLYGNGLKKNLIAINEISIFRQSKQTASLNISIGQKKIIKSNLRVARQNIKDLIYINFITLYVNI